MTQPVFVDSKDRLNFFFIDPQTPPDRATRGNIHSVLYLLRRELISTAGYDPSITSESDLSAAGIKTRHFASMILMFTLIDLLAKAVYGNRGGVGKRFKDFISHPDIAGHSTEAELFWAARNGLVHAFGGPDMDELAKLGLRRVAFQPRRETMYPDGETALHIVDRRGDAAVIYVDGALSVTATAIDRCHHWIRRNSSRHAAFDQFFAGYGTIEIIR